MSLSVRSGQWSFSVSIIALLLAACGGALVTANVVDTPNPQVNNNEPASVASDANDNAQSPGIPTPLPGNLDQITFIEDNQEYVIRQLIPRDGIAPIYNPQFTTAANSGYNDNELVMGVEINGDARAYAVGIMRSREIANDVIGGTPVLVTW